MIQALDRIDTLREASSGLMEVYLSVVNNSLNEVMKTLTIIATIFLPLGLVASAYGMNVAFPRSEEHTSELQSQSNLVCRLLLEKKNDVVMQQPQLASTAFTS